MTTSTTDLVVAPDTLIDLHLHTLHSDGTWQPEQLLDHLLREHFGLGAITDHDRVDIVATFQQLAIDKQMPILAAAEMTTTWRDDGTITDLLCYGIDPANCDPLLALAQDVLRRQQDNTREVFANLRAKGYGDETTADADLAAILAKPSAQQPHELFAYLVRHECDEPPGQLLMSLGCDFMTTPPAAVVEAAHHCGAVCLIAHPGRTDGFTTFDVALLDQFRVEMPIDGIEVYYPRHTPEQVAMYEAYAQKHGLLMSAGSDSHGPDKQLPITYRADQCRALLERVGIEVT